MGGRSTARTRLAWLRPGRAQFPAQNPTTPLVHTSAQSTDDAAIRGAARRMPRRRPRQRPSGQPRSARGAACAGPPHQSAKTARSLPADGLGRGLFDQPEFGGGYADARHRHCADSAPRRAADHVTHTPARLRSPPSRGPTNRLVHTTSVPKAAAPDPTYR